MCSATTSRWSTSGYPPPSRPRSPSRGGSGRRAASRAGSGRAVGANALDRAARAGRIDHADAPGRPHECRAPMFRLPDASLRTKLYVPVIGYAVLVAGVLFLANWLIGMYRVHGPVYQQIADD